MERGQKIHEKEEKKRRDALMINVNRVGGLTKERPDREIRKSKPVKRERDRKRAKIRA